MTGLIADALQRNDSSRADVANMAACGEDLTREEIDNLVMVVARRIKMNPFFALQRWRKLLYEAKDNAAEARLAWVQGRGQPTRE